MPLTATFLLVLPYAFNYDMTVVLLGFALILFRQWEEIGALERVALIGGFITPQLTFLGKIVGFPIAPLVLIGGLYVQVRLCRPRDENGAGPALPSLASPALDQASPPSAARRIPAASKRPINISSGSAVGSLPERLRMVGSWNGCRNSSSAFAGEGVRMKCGGEPY